MVHKRSGPEETLRSVVERAMGAAKEAAGDEARDDASIWEGQVGDELARVRRRDADRGSRGSAR